MQMAPPSIEDPSIEHEEKVGPKTFVSNCGIWPITRAESNRFDSNIEMSELSASEGSAATCLGMVFRGVDDIDIGQIPMPQVEAPTDAVLRVIVCGICGSDLHPLHGKEPCAIGTAFGHECVGEIVSTGSSISGFKVGDRCIVPFSVACGTCYYCSTGRSARCEHSQLLGWKDPETGRGLHGAQSEYVRIPQANGSLYKLPTGLDVEEGLLLGDIASTAAFGVAQAGLAGWEGAEEGNSVLAMKHLLQRTVSRHEDGRVSFKTLAELDVCAARPSPVCVVVGCGPVGLLAVAMARLCLLLRGFTNPCVIAIDGVRERINAAENWGATSLLLKTGASLDGLTPEEIIERVKICSKESGRSGRGADVVIECVGHPSALKLSFDILAPFGTISSLGVHTSPFPFTPGDVYDKNATFRSGRCPARSMMDSAELLVKVAKQGREGVLEPMCMTDIVTHRFPISQGRHAYDIFDRKQDGCLKALLYPNMNEAPEK